AALSPSFGALATPVAWQAMHVLSKTCLPLAAPAAGLAALPGAAAATAAGFCADAFGAGSLNFAPDWFAMNTTARATSSSESDAFPPFGGMPRIPLIASFTISFRPSLMRGAQAALSPIFGAPATPVWWHAAQVDFTT